MGCGASAYRVTEADQADQVDQVDQADAAQALAPKEAAQDTPQRNAPETSLGWLLETSTEIWEAFPEDVDQTLTEAYYGDLAESHCCL